MARRFSTQAWQYANGAGMTDALLTANELYAQRQAAGFDQAALDEAAQHGFGNGAFEVSEEDAGAIAEEFDHVAESQTQKIPPYWES